MTIIDIQKIPFKEKKALVNDACLMYKKIKVMHEKTKVIKNLKLSDKIRNDSLANIKSLSMFETILGLLGPQEISIIENEFLNSDYYQSKYIESNWSKTTYYKIKHRAIDNFVFLLFA